MMVISINNDVNVNNDINRKKNQVLPVLLHCYIDSFLSVCETPRSEGREPLAPSGSGYDCNGGYNYSGCYDYDLHPIGPAGEGGCVMCSWQPSNIPWSYPQSAESRSPALTHDEVRRLLSTLPWSSREVGRQERFVLEGVGWLCDVVLPLPFFNYVFSAASAHCLQPQSHWATPIPMKWEQSLNRV